MSAHGPDAKILGIDVSHADPTSERGAALAHPRNLGIPAAPVWWPAGPGDATALAYWRGGIAATMWMADIIER